MRIVRKYLILFAILSMICGYFVIFSGDGTYAILEPNSDRGDHIETVSKFPESLPALSSDQNYINIEEIFSEKLSDFSTQGYFPEIYFPSLHATYYAVYILNAIGELGSINETQIVNFVMSYYNESFDFFIDDYAQRYLDIDFSDILYSYFPFTTLLEVNSYAIMTLDMLGNLSLIDRQGAVDFIWSCYNPVTGGFIGRPYDSSLSAEFKIPTMDNTYFALTALDLLMEGSWGGYISEKANIINFIKSLQSTGFSFGAFYNDLDVANFNSLDYDTSILSSYYCIKSLEIFGVLGSIRMDDFLVYLDDIYREEVNWFQYFYEGVGGIPQERLNVPSSAIGLELSDIVSFPSISRSDVLNFVLNGRNSMGSWDQISGYGYHELIDSYQVVRSLVGAGEISQLTSSDIIEITNAMNKYISGEGYSTLSEDYSSLSQLYTIINSFDLYDRVSDLDIGYIYGFIDSLISKDTYPGHEYGTSVTQTEPLITPNNLFRGNFRTYPIEYSFPNKHDSLMTLYMALDSLDKINKLGDFDISYDLDDIILEIVNSQYLNDLQTNYGGFMSDSYWNSPRWDGIPIPESFRNNDVHFEYSYWAIKSLKLISDYKSLGDYDSMGVDTQALYSYIFKDVIETPSVLYYESEYSENIEDNLESTYYMVYILSEIGLYNLDNQKIKNYINDNLDYSNIRNIYFAWKISEILSIGIDFNLDLIYDLIKNLYSEDYNEYYLTTERKQISQEVFLWVCEIYSYALSDSMLFINILNLENYKFMSSGNNITFSINSTLSGNYWIWINNSLLGTNSFDYEDTIFSYSLDDYTSNLGDYSVKINATSKDNNYCETTSTFSVYSSSSTIINILSLNNYEFMTEGNNISFQINSEYPDKYNLSIDEIEISSGQYNNGQIFNFSIDGYSVGTYNVSIWAIALDGKEGIARASFTVYSNSETIIKVYEINNYIYNTLGNILNFSIFSDYPDHFELKIDDVLVESRAYISGEFIVFSIDGYDTGFHNVFIWANSSDNKESSYYLEFHVFIESFIYIDILDLPNYEFKTTGNEINFMINASFPDKFKFYIDGILKFEGFYNFGGDIINISIDNCLVGEREIQIWTNDTFGKEFICESSFTVYSFSNTIVEIESLDDYEFMTTGNYVKFNVSSWYPDYFKIYIDDIEIYSEQYENGEFFTYSIDNYYVGSHNVSIWAIGEDGKKGTASGEFIVYSYSNTLININEVPNYLFTSTGNYINFSVSSKYPGLFNVSVDGTLITEGAYTPDEDIYYSIDGYNVSIHNIVIFAKGIDGKEVRYETVFNVYTNSATLIVINNLTGSEFMSEGNIINFTIYSDFPDYFEIWIDGGLVLTDYFLDGISITYSLDNYTDSLGDHSIYIWATGKDFVESTIYTMFSVYSDSVTYIQINNLHNCVFMSKGNTFNFTIYSKYPDFYKLWIDGVLVRLNNYLNENPIIFSIDNYTNQIGTHNISTWAIGLDGKISTININFRVFSSSMTEIQVKELPNYEFKTEGNCINFSLLSNYSDTFSLTIDDTLLYSNGFYNGEKFSFSIDGYSIGIHNVFIRANGTDGTEDIFNGMFEVFPHSNNIIIFEAIKEDSKDNTIESDLDQLLILIYITPSLIGLCLVSFISYKFINKKRKLKRSIKIPFGQVHIDPSIEKIKQKIGDKKLKGLTEEEKEIIAYIDATTSKKRVLGTTFLKKFPDKGILEGLANKNRIVIKSGSGGKNYIHLKN